MCQFICIKEENAQDKIIPVKIPCVGWRNPDKIHSPEAFFLHTANMRTIGRIKDTAPQSSHVYQLIELQQEIKYAPRQIRKYTAQLVGLIFVQLKYENGGKRMENT